MYNFPISFFPKKILIIISKFLSWSKLCPHGLKVTKETSISNHIWKKLQKLKIHWLQCKKLSQKRILSTSTFCFKSRTIKGTYVWVSRSVVPDSLQPPGQQPTRLPCPWDSPGKNTGVGCHFLLQGMKEKSESEVAQSCSTPSDPMDCSLPGSSVHGIFQARVLEWGATAFSGNLS